MYTCHIIGNQKRIVHTFVQFQMKKLSLFKHFTNNIPFGDLRSMLPEPVCALHRVNLYGWYKSLARFIRRIRRVGRRSQVTASWLTRNRSASPYAELRFGSRGRNLAHKGMYNQIRGSTIQPTDTLGPGSASIAEWLEYDNISGSTILSTDTLTQGLPR